MQLSKSEVSKDEKRTQADREIRERFLNEMVPCLRELRVPFSLHGVKYVRQSDGSFQLRIKK